MKKVLITGAAGFIGSHLGERLLAEGCDVVGVDNFDPFYARSRKEENLTKQRESKAFHFYEMDLTDAKKLDALLADEKPDVVVHLAAKAGVRPSLAEPIAYCRANLEASIALFESMRKAGCKNLVFASSSSVYGRSPRVPFRTDDPLEDAISVYATTKQNGEQLTRLYRNLYGFRVVNLRFFTVYGPRQRPDLAIHKFLKAHLNGDGITVFGDGSMARDYTFVSDTVAGVVAAARRVSDGRADYETFNLGNENPVSLNVLLEAVAEATGKTVPIQREDVPLGDVPITFADITTATEALGYRPQVPLKEGLARFVHWFEEDPARLQKTPKTAPSSPANDLQA